MKKKERSSRTSNASRELHTRGKVMFVERKGAENNGVKSLRDDGGGAAYDIHN